MNDQAASRRTKLETALWGLIVVAVPFLILSNPTSSYDVFYHLRVGLDVMADRSLHSVDAYSFTGKGTPSENWMWGFGILLVLYRNLFGMDWFQLFVGLFGLAACLFIYRAVRDRGCSPGTALILTAGYAMAVRFRMLPRPHLASILFCALFLLVLERNRANPRLRTALLIAPIVALWSCMHPSSLFGLLILFCYVGEGLIPYVMPGMVLKPFQTLVRNRNYLATSLVAAGGAIAAYVAMPLTRERFGFILEILLQPDHHVHQLAEYAPLKFQNHFIFFFMTGLAAALALVDYKRLRPALLVWVIGFLPSAILHSRTAVELAPALAGLIAIHGCNLAGPYSSTLTRLMPRRIFIGILLLVGAVWMNTEGFTLAPLRKTDYSKLPKDALAFADHIGLSGPMYNSYHFGNYLIYHFDPRRPVFSDAREWPYRRLYREMRESTPEALFEKYNISWALVDNNDLIYTNKLFYAGSVLRDINQWRAVYFDELAMILVRIDGPDGKLLKDFGFETILPWRTAFDYLGQWLSDPRVGELIEKDLARAHVQCPGPMEALWAASWLAIQGKADEAIALLTPAWNQSRNPVVGARYGQLLVRAGRIDEGREVLEQVVRKAPTKASAHMNLGVAYLQLGRARKAAREFRLALKHQADWPLAYFNLGLAEEDLGKRSRARKAYEQVLGLDGQSSLALDAQKRLDELQ